MKKFLVFVLSLVCGAAIASCAGGNGGETKNAETVYLTDREITMYVGETYKFTPSGAESYAYTTSDESVARINKNGVLTGISDGTAFIDVSAGEAATTCRVKRYPPRQLHTPERRAAYRGGGQRRYAESGSNSRRKGFGRESEIFL